MRKALLVALALLWCSEGHAARLMLVLVDKSASTTADETLYHESVTSIVNSLAPGDRFLVAPITGTSGADLRQLRDYTLPDAVPPQGWLDEPIARRRAVEQQTRETQTIMKHLHADVNVLLAAPNKAQRTAIFESLRAVAPLLAGETRRQKVLIILSDMVEESEVANFANSVLSPTFTTKELARQRKAHIIPNLHGVNVCVGGALASPPERAAAQEQFWRNYFAVTGARITPAHYGRVVAPCLE